MTKYLNIPEKDLKACGGYWTAREITQQPEMWLKTARTIEEGYRDINSWLKPILNTPNLNIVLTGAGTSAFAGEALLPHLRKHLTQRVEAISTTDIVSSPSQYFKKSTPTLLVSFARSGNSPESTAACELADQVIENCYHLVITCSPDGALARYADQNSARKCILMPIETLDNSFAMTSSFTSMMVAAICIFSPNKAYLEKTCTYAHLVLQESVDKLECIAKKPFGRIAFLGSGVHKGIATEAALKMLELTAGKTDCYSDSSLGFRHGPKSLVDSETLIICLKSTDAYTALYDHDLKAEILKDERALNIVDLSDLLCLSDFEIKDIWKALIYIIGCQIIAFYKSLVLKITPDNPCPTGEVNRVVQGVRIYPFKD